MAKRIKVISPKQPRINVISPRQPVIDPDVVAKALGAERLDPEHPSARRMRALNKRAHRSSAPEETPTCSHEPDIYSIRAADGVKDTIDISCKRCGISGSFLISSITNINWE